MFKSLFIAALLAVSGSAFASETNPEDCVYINKVRAFAPESDNTLIVRQGKGIYRRIEVENHCPMQQADRIGFSYGNSLLYVQSATSNYTRVTKGSIVGRFCTATPHSNVVFIDDDAEIDQRCRITRISGATQTDFEATQNGKDNRY